MLTAKEKSLLSALEPRAASEGVEIVTLEIVGSKKAPTIRVYIDAAGGISFDELARTQAWVGDVMDELDPFPGAYMLEVSSPGIDRPLAHAGALRALCRRDGDGEDDRPHRRPQLVYRRASRLRGRLRHRGRRRRRHLPHSVRQHQKARVKGTIDFSA